MALFSSVTAIVAPILLIALTLNAKRQQLTAHKIYCEGKRIKVLQRHVFLSPCTFMFLGVTNAIGSISQNKHQLNTANKNVNLHKSTKNTNYSLKIHKLSKNGSFFSHKKQCFNRLVQLATTTRHILDGGSHILLANMLSPKRLVCSNNFHMAHPVPSYPYVLVNRSLLCNCHLESDLTYVLKSLGSCSVKNKFTMYFSLNSAFNHYMHKFGLPSQNDSFTSLFTYEPVFDIFLNKRLSFRPQINDSIPLLSLNPPDTLLELFQSFPNIPPVHPNSPFFPLVRHTSDVNPTKGSFLTSTIAHVVYLTTSCVVVCIVAPQIYLSFKHKKLRTLVTAMTLQRLLIGTVYHNYHCSVLTIYLLYLSRSSPKDPVILKFRSVNVLHGPMHA